MVSGLPKPPTIQERARLWLDSAPKQDATFTLVSDLEAEIAKLKACINSPITDDWLDGVRFEAAHQQLRWQSDHDAGKTHPDWFWLVGYLAGKALFAAMQGDAMKAKHHTISTGAALLNWWRHITGDATGMRPGIEPPKGEPS